MSFQHTNLIDPPTWAGLQNFTDVLNDPLFMTAVKNTAYFAGLASASRWSVEPRDDGTEPRRDLATLELGFDAARLKPSRSIPLG